ncbi:MAG: MerR family transcriptional regulator [Desulfobacterales bacterium]|nr:MerR family transcriptional regulator [Desulfobacterales bacterium]
MPDQNSSLTHIPDKLYFRIGEVSKIAQIPAYVLRFWESEFSRIRPKRTAAGQRLYSRTDIELILKIKTLLYEKKFTIQGARQHLSVRSRKNKASEQQLLADLHAELKSIRDLLAE